MQRLSEQEGEKSIAQIGDGFETFQAANRLTKRIIKITSGLPSGAIHAPLHSTTLSVLTSL
jgi:hypothetical protein